MSEANLKDVCAGQLPELMLFDLDGTLVDSIPDLAASVDHMLTYGGYPVAGESRVRQWVGNGAQMLVRRALAWATSAEPEALSDTLVELNLETFLVYYRDHCGDQTTLFDGVREALEALQAQGVKMAVVTNKPAQFVPLILSATGIDGFFERWLGGDSLEFKKPHPLPLHYLLEKMAVVPARALMVGDSRTDIEAARAAGVAVVAVSYGYNPGQPVALESPDLVVDSLTELAAAYAVTA